MKDLPAVAVLPVAAWATFFNRQLCFTKPDDAKGHKGLQAVISVHLIYIGFCMQVLMPWIQDDYSAPFGMRLLGLAVAYAALLPIYLRANSEELFMEIFAYTFPMAWIMGLAESYHAEYLEAIKFDLAGGVSDSRIAIGGVPIIIVLLWSMRLFLTLAIGEATSREEKNRTFGTRCAAATSIVLSLMYEMAFSTKGSLRMWSLDEGTPIMFGIYPAYQLLPDAMFATFLMAGFSDYVTLVDTKFPQRMILAVFPALAYSMLLGASKGLADWVAIYL